MKRIATIGVGVVAAASALSAIAGSEPYFNPLTQSGVVAAPNAATELNHPWVTPPGITAVNLLSMSTVEADAMQSIQRVDAGNVSSMFDMLAYDPTGNYIFIPHETPFGAGVSRHDVNGQRTELLFAGDQGSVTEGCEADPLEPRDPTFACEGWDLDFAAFDPARWTPNGTVILGEEWSGLGRIVEVMNPMGPAPADPSAAALEDGVDYRIWESIAKVAHEGINFSVAQPKRIVYFIDEWNSGSIYKLVLKKWGDYAVAARRSCCQLTTSPLRVAILPQTGMRRQTTRQHDSAWRPGYLLRTRTATRYRASRTRS